MNEAAIKTYLGDDTEDPIEKIMDKLEESRFFSSEEVGFVHPFTSSVVKLKDNGMIDIFAATNQGIRIDPKTKTVNFFANHEKHHSGQISAWIEHILSIEAKRAMIFKAFQISLESKSLDITMDEGIIKANKLNLDVPEEGLTFSGTTLKEMNDRMKSMEDSIEETNRNFSDLSGELGNAFDQISSLESRINDMGSEGE